MPVYKVNVIYKSENIVIKDFWFDDFDKACDFVKNHNCYQFSITKIYKVKGDKNENI